MTTEAHWVVAPELFEFVTEFSDSIASGDASTTDPIRKRHPLYVFVENFLAQFSNGYLGEDVQGFTSRSQTQLITARRRLESEEGTEEAQRLIFALEPMCSRLRELSYSESDEDLEEFYHQSLPGLLLRIEKWLEEIQADEELLDAARNARKEYSRALGEL